MPWSGQGGVEATETREVFHQRTGGFDRAYLTAFLDDLLSHLQTVNTCVAPPAATLTKYHNRLINGAEVIKALIQIRKDMVETERRGKELRLQPEEVAFYDAVAEKYQAVYGDEFLSGLVRKVVQKVKGSLKVDWTRGHRDDVKAAVRVAVKRVLSQEGVKEEDFDGLLRGIMEQAEAVYADWPLVA